jgi:site-specific recombinase
MATAGRGDDPKKAKLVVPSLREQGHKEIMDLLRLADKSQYPEIRAAALDMAKHTSKHQRSQDARVPPTLILVVDIACAVTVGLACWYAFLHYPPHVAYELSSIYILLFLVVVGISLFLAGYLSQSNFMKILNWPVAHIKKWWSSAQKTSGH